MDSQGTTRDTLAVAHAEHAMAGHGHALNLTVAQHGIAVQPTCPRQTVDQREMGSQGTTRIR